MGFALRGLRTLPILQGEQKVTREHKNRAHPTVLNRQDAKDAEF